MKFAVVMVSAQHVEAFREAGEAVHYALLALGHNSILVNTGPAGVGEDRTVILLGWNVITPLERDMLRPDTIIYNLEQPGSHWMQAKRLARFREFQWWDWTVSGMAMLQALGHRARCVPIGYVPEWERIGPPQATSEIPIAEKCFDVLFYGSMSVRRRAVLEKLKKRLGGNKVIWLYGTYGEKRDDYIAHSKLVLNMHYDYRLRQPLELCRVGYLLANRVLVLSENSDGASFLQTKMNLVPEYQLVRRACELLEFSEEERRAMADDGYRGIITRPMIDILRPIVGTACPSPA